VLTSNPVFVEAGEACCVELLWIGWGVRTTVTLPILMCCVAGLRGVLCAGLTVDTLLSLHVIYQEEIMRTLRSSSRHHVRVTAVPTMLLISSTLQTILHQVNRSMTGRISCSANLIASSTSSSTVFWPYSCLAKISPSTLACASSMRSLRLLASM
jgi:hypothetical protein